MEMNHIRQTYGYSEKYGYSEAYVENIHFLTTLVGMIFADKSEDKIEAISLMIMTFLICHVSRYLNEFRWFSLLVNL